MSSTAASPTSRSDIGAEYRAAREKWDIASGVLWNYLDSTAAQTTAAIATDEMAALMRRPEPSPPLDHILLLESLLNELPTLPESARTPAPGELQSQHYKLLEAIINATKGTQGDLRELDTKYEYTPGPATEIIATLAETTPPSAP